MFEGNDPPELIPDSIFALLITTSMVDDLQECIMSIQPGLSILKGL